MRSPSFLMWLRSISMKPIAILLSLFALLAIRAIGYAKSTSSNSSASAPKAHGHLSHDPRSRALRAAGDKEENSYQWAAAISDYQQAFRIDKETHPDDAADDLNEIAICYASRSQYSQAIEYFYQSVPFCERAGDKGAEATALTNIGNCYQSLSQSAKAVRYHLQALSLFQKIGDAKGAATALNNLGDCAETLSKYTLAIETFNLALKMDKLDGDTDGQAKALNNIGVCYQDLSQYPKAIDSLNQALSLVQQAGDKEGQAQALENLGNCYESMGQYTTAIQYHNQSLPLFQQVGDKDAAARAQSNIGSCYKSLSQYPKAIDYFTQTLPVFLQAGDKIAVANEVMNIGDCYEGLSQYAKAIDFLNRALPIFQQAGDRDRTASTLNDIGVCYEDLNQSVTAIEYHQRSLAICQKVGDKDGEANALSNIGICYENLGLYAKAIDYHNQAIPILQKAGDKDGQAGAFMNIGICYEDIDQYDKALDYLNRSLAIHEAIGDRQGQADALGDIGTCYGALGQYSQAIDRYDQALPILQLVGNQSGQAAALENLMVASKEQDKPSLAIFYGKQAVNLYQQIYTQTQGLGAQAQKTYIQAHEKAFRFLADLLIRQGRLPEAETVLAMLKQEEFIDTLGKDALRAGPPDTSLAATPAEQLWQQKYDQMGQDVEYWQQQAQTLAGIDNPTKDQQQQYQAANAKLDQATQAFQGFLDSLPGQFTDTALGENRRTDIAHDTAIEGTLKQWLKQGVRVAAIFTVESDNEYAVILTTPYGHTPGVSPISSADLNQKIARLRDEVTQNAATDPRPDALDLYKILVGPIEKPLEDFRPQVILWSLDGDLRYLPVAALWDGKEYLAQRYESVLFDPAMAPEIDQPRADWSAALGLGVSQPEPGFPALHYVPQELAAIIKDPTEQGSNGVMPGRFYLNSAFTKLRLQTDLQSQDYPVVHIASHFAFDSSQPGQSYLLLGDGKLSLTDIQDGLFQGVDLLTLSACSTAMGSPAVIGGKEIDGLGETAEVDGAKSVVATLWDVNDASTALFMKVFYQALASDPKMTKAQALQQAQLALLTGQESTSQPESSPSSDRAFGPALPNADAGGTPFKPVPGAPYAHPHYWAPFILMGNWR